MKKVSSPKPGEELRANYDLSQLKGGVRGKYLRKFSAGTNLVLIEPDLAQLFPDSDAVNRALRLLSDTARAATSVKPHRPKAG